MSTAVAPHYTPEALKFLRGLKRNNDREWFNARKSTYERQVKAPTQALVEAVNEHLLRFAPDHVRPPQKAVFRIYRDTRFSSDKRPYKNFQGAWWARTGLEKTSGGGFYFHVGGDEILIAAGAYMPDRDQLLAIRRHIEAHPDEMRALLKSRKLRALMSEFDGNRLTRLPKGFLPDSPAADLLLNRQWGFSATLPAAAATSPTLVKEIVKRFEAVTPLINYLNTPLTPKPRKPLF